MNSRLALIDLSTRVLAGNEISEVELSSAVLDPTTLNRIERLAWQRLSQWLDDDDIRAKDENYADLQRRQIGSALADLKALEAGFQPSKIAVGEHQATHVPLVGCLAALTILSALLYAMFLNGFFMHGD